MYQIILTPGTTFHTGNIWDEFQSLVEYVFTQFKGDTHSLTELAVSLDRAYTGKQSHFYPIYTDGAIMVHLKSEVEEYGLQQVGPPHFTIKKAD